MSRIDENFIFFENANSPTNGTEMKVNFRDTVRLEVYGTTTSRTVTFNAKMFSDTVIPIQAVNLSTYEMAKQTTGNNEIWEIDCRGLESVIINLTSVSGGNCSCKGRVIS